MAKPRKTENPDEVMKWMNPDMDEETSSGQGNVEDLQEEAPEGIGAGFTNSPLVTYTRMSPYKNSPRNQPITKIIIHHMAGVASVESFGEIVTRPGRNMSANYAIGNDGRIGLYCDEEDRCWCSSSAWADNRGIAIEVSNSKVGGNWPISKAAWESMINLCADICKRNNIPKLVYTGDKNGSLCFHRFFAATGCVPIDTTEVLTPTGWTPIRDISVGDSIATASPNDFSIKFDTVENMTPVHEDLVYTQNGMSVTGEHRVLFSDNGNGYRFEEYAKIPSNCFNIPTGGTYHAAGMNISASEMVFLLETQRIGNIDDTQKTIEFSYITESKVGYMDGLLKNIGYEFTRKPEDLGPVKFIITDERAYSLCKEYLSGKEFNWKWLEMNPTQFSYFIYKVTKHVDTGWDRSYTSDSITNINIVQAICAFNERGTVYNENDNVLYVKDTPYRSIDTATAKKSYNVKVACVTVKSGCFLMRQNGVTMITGNCPGEYIFSRAQQICDEVNAKLGTPTPTPAPTPTPEPDPEPVKREIEPGTLVSIDSGATYYNSTTKVPKWVYTQRWYVSQRNGNRVVINDNESNTSHINSPIDAKYLTVVQNAAHQPVSSPTSYLKKISKGEPIYQISPSVRQISSVSISSLYTIVEENVVEGKKFGKLKSGAGWIFLGESAVSKDNTINVGDTVKPITNKTYDGKTFVIYEKSYKVLRVNGDRVVISSDGKNATAAVKASNLIKL